MPHSNGGPEGLITAFLEQRPEDKDTPPGTPSLEGRVARLEAQLRRAVDPSIVLGRDLIDLGQVPSCGVHKTLDQTIATGDTWVEISFGTVTWDTDQMADAANNGITIRRAGLYLVTMNLRWAVDADGRRGLRVHVNDSITFMGAGDEAPATINSRQSCSTPRYFDIGDTITAQVQHTAGADLALQGSTATQHGPQLTATLISDTGSVRTEMA